MTIDEAKKLLPPELKYPLPDGVIDNLINVKAIPLQFDFSDEDGNNNKGMDYAMMAALIELKERREKEKTMKIGTKAKVIEIWSVFSGEIVELVDETNTEYIFTNDKHKRGRLIVPKDLVDDYVEWESGEDGRE